MVSSSYPSNQGFAFNGFAFIIQFKYKQVVKVILQKGRIATAHDGSVIFAGGANVHPI